MGISRVGWPAVLGLGANISIRGARTRVSTAIGAAYWDGKGAGGGKKKPKFFQAHGLVDSEIKGVRIVNGPVHVFSISSCKNLTWRTSPLTIHRATAWCIRMLSIYQAVAVITIVGAIGSKPGRLGVPSTPEGQVDERDQAHEVQH